MAARPFFLAMLNLSTDRDLALRLGIAASELQHVAAHHGEYHSSYRNTINRKRRHLYVVAPRLANILKRIDALLQTVPLPDGMHGSRKGHRPSDAARPHVGHELLGKIDISNFFPHITPDRVRAVFTSLGCTDHVAGLLTRLTTADNHLPQGFNSSSSIANLVIAPAMSRMNGLARHMDLDVTNYLDDIALSGDQRVKYAHRVGLRIIDSSRLVVNRRKSQTVPRSESQRVVGFTVNQRLSVPRDYRRNLLLTLHKCRAYGPLSQCPDGDLGQLRRSLAGRIQHVRARHPRQGRELQKVFEQIAWPS